jgi:hypothetical protein
MKSTLLLLFLVIGIAAGQDAKSWKLPLTPDGHPDLQGVWTAISCAPSRTLILDYRSSNKL